MNSRSRHLTILVCASFAGALAQGPSVDRVGYPANYQTTFKKMMTFDRGDNGQVRVIWANETAANTPWWETYPYGSVLIFEQWTAKRDAAGILMYDNGRLIPDTLTVVNVQRKEAGFGTAYGPNRNGEWEYMAYRPDGSPNGTPESTANCATCHFFAGNQEFVYRRQKFGKQSGAQPNSTLSYYTFYPAEITVKAGTMFTWANDDEVEHQIRIADMSVTSPRLEYSVGYSVKLDQPGTYEVRCPLHAGMKQVITVVK